MDESDTINMSPSVPNPATSKYAWSLIARAAPPKRTADERVTDFKEIYSDFDEATVREQASRCLQCPNPLCAQACPLSNRIPEWIALAAQGRFLEAAALSRSTSNLPEICSRVCPQERLCEGACQLNCRSDPVAIGAIERFINEYAFAHGAVEPVIVESNGLRAAIIGSGPAGLACADQLAKLGYRTTVYESLMLPGGLLVNGIPSFKIEKSIIARRVDYLAKCGVEFKLGVTVGRDVSLAELRRSNDAVFLGHGAQKPKSAGVPGEDLRGVERALPFLIQKNVESDLIDLPPIDVAGKRVVVLGGGDTAMDCLRTSLRAGAKSAICVYRRDFANMPGSRKEYYNALEEGAEFQFLTNPTEILPNGHGGITGVRCVRMELGARDATGRSKPRAVPGSEFDLPVDVVLVAYGFDPVAFPNDSEFAAIKVSETGAIIVDQNKMTSLPGVFAGGDSARGPSLVSHAAIDARRAAAGIHRYLAPKLASIAK